MRFTLDSYFTEYSDDKFLVDTSNTLWYLSSFRPWFGILFFGWKNSSIEIFYSKGHIWAHQNLHGLLSLKKISSPSLWYVYFFIHFVGRLSKGSIPSLIIASSKMWFLRRVAQWWLEIIASKMAWCNVCMYGAIYGYNIYVVFHYFNLIFPSQG
jgi:hypothetical protein